jgi:hypothetical protein
MTQQIASPSSHIFIVPMRILVSGSIFLFLDGTFGIFTVVMKFIIIVIFVVVVPATEFDPKEIVLR